MFIFMIIDSFWKGEVIRTDFEVGVEAETGSIQDTMTGKDLEEDPEVEVQEGWEAPYGTNIEVGAERILNTEETTTVDQQVEAERILNTEGTTTVDQEAVVVRDLQRTKTEIKFIKIQNTEALPT